VPQLTIFMILRAASGIGILCALLVSAYNVFRTLFSGGEAPPVQPADAEVAR